MSCLLFTSLGNLKQKADVDKNIILLVLKLVTLMKITQVNVLQLLLQFKWPLCWDIEISALDPSILYGISIFSNDCIFHYLLEFPLLFFYIIKLTRYLLSGSQLNIAEQSPIILNNFHVFQASIDKLTSNASVLPSVRNCVILPGRGASSIMAEATVSRTDLYYL